MVETLQKLKNKTQQTIQSIFFLNLTEKNNKYFKLMDFS